MYVISLNIHMIARMNMAIHFTIVRTEIQRASFFFFNMSLMIQFLTKTLHMHIVNTA